MTTFFISDHHFNHANILNFKRADGEPLRNFSSVEEMNEKMITAWNSVVSGQDKVYHLGDFAFGKNPTIASRLKGKKRLVRGNHDKFRLKEYAVHFEEVYGVRTLQNCVLTHIPIHVGSIGRWGLNLHGHLHHHTIDDSRYFNVSVERLNYVPISVEEVRQVTGVNIL